MPELNTIANKNEQSPLLRAITCRSNLVEIEKLIEKGADLNFRGPAQYGQTPLHLAALHKNVGLVKVLLKYGAAIDIEDYMHNTPLCIAVFTKHQEITKVLIEHGAQIKYSHFLSDLGISKILSSARDQIDAKDEFGDAFLHRAIHRLDLVKILLEGGAQVDIRDNHGRTPLHNGVFYIEKVSIIKTLLEWGAQVDVRDNYGTTPLMLAIQYKSLAIIKVLLSNGARVDVKDDIGNSILVYAINTDKLAIIKTLLLAGVPINVEDLKYGSFSESKLNNLFSLLLILKEKKQALDNEVIQAFRRHLLKAGSGFEDTLKKHLFENALQQRNYPYFFDRLPSENTTLEIHEELRQVTVALWLKLDEKERERLYYIVINSALEQLPPELLNQVMYWMFKSKLEEAANELASALTESGEMTVIDYVRIKLHQVFDRLAHQILQDNCSEAEKLTKGKKIVTAADIAFQKERKAINQFAQEQAEKLLSAYR